MGNEHSILIIEHFKTFSCRTYFSKLNYVNNKHALAKINRYMVYYIEVGFPCNQSYR